MSAPPAARWPLRSPRGERWRLASPLAVAAAAEVSVIVGFLFLHGHLATAAPDAPAVTVVFSPPAVPAPPAPEPVTPAVLDPPAERTPPPAATVPALAAVPALAPLPTVQAPEPVEPSMSEPPEEPATPPATAAPALPGTPTLALPPPMQAPSPLRRPAPPPRRPRERTLASEQPATAQDAAQDARPASTPVASSAPAPAVRSDASAAAAATFDDLLRRAIQAAVRYPAAAQMMGLAGRARVDFDYRDGAVGAVRLEQSAGSPLLDGAALAAVRSARYPSPPRALAGQTLSRRLWVDLEAGGREE